MLLSSIQTATGHFTIAPFDHRGSLANLLNLDLTKPADQHILRQVKTMMMEIFSPLCSGVLIDPEYGYDAIAKKAPNCGLILTLESSGYTDSRSAIPTLIPNWGVEGVKNNYAVAKLLMYYHPEETNAEPKKKLVAELYDYCQHEQVPFLFEPVIYDPATGKDLPKNQFAAAQLAMIQELREYCDVIKIQYPGDALSCATVTAELDVPWILLSRGMNYQEFKLATMIAIENGCAGFAAGRSVWQEIGEQRHPDKTVSLPGIRNFLETTGVQRMKELIGLVEK
jgi:tagatose-1,6-bisphosphate aldolase